MEKESALQAYIRAVQPEREEFLRQRAQRKARETTRSLPAEARREYMEGRGFENLLYHIRRADKAYQAMGRGELALEFHQAEFERLAPLIEEELAAGNEIDLPFLRSVERCRVPLQSARECLALLSGRALRRLLDGQTRRFLHEAENKTERLLRKGDLGRFTKRPLREGDIVAWAMETAFAHGVTAEMVESAFHPKTLAASLRAEVERAFPETVSCAEVRAPSGETVAEAVKKATDAARKAVCTGARKRFPPDRLRALLKENPSLKRMQKQADAAFARERTLRKALLGAIPEHYRDLYPLARAMRRRFILHLGPTNSGKTYEGVGRLRGAWRGIYLGPLRLLAAEQFETLNLNDVPCSLVTGEEQILVPGSRVQSSTVEMADLTVHYDVAVIDECQMIADRDRGGAWTAAILGLCADEIHACASPDAEGLLTRIIRECGDDLTIVRHERMTPLAVEKQGFQFPSGVRRGDALIVFSKARVHAVAAELKRKGYKVSLIYGALPPDVRRDQAVRFSQGDTDVVVSTDAIAMGMNLPIERVVFLESEKFDGDIVRPLTDAEIKQIAGRAGRYGQYDIGYVNAFGFKGTVARALTKPLLPLTEAVIGFPESLIGIPLPLTAIIEQWLAMKDKSCFSKASTVRMASLAAMMETKRTDKALLYRFLCIPFDETDPDLLGRWRAMYHAECAHEHVDVLAGIPEYLDPEECTTAMLDSLEADYRRCDLYYNYTRLFLEEPQPLLEEIGRRKSLISQGIIHILSTQKLQQKTCPVCGRNLPWNWPYRLCDLCWRRRG